MIKVPRLSKGKGYKGPDFYGSCNTGTAPAIFHSRSDKYVVGPEMACRDAMREGILLSNKRAHGEGRRRIWIFKGREPAINKFMALCGERIMENHEMAKEHAAARAKAANGDLLAAMYLGDF